MKILNILTVALLLVLAGCGRKGDEEAAEQAIKAATGADVEVTEDGGTVKMKTEDGEDVTVTAGGDAKLPADFPKDVPLYKGAKMVATANTPEGVQVSLQSSDAADTVAAGCRKLMEAEGWTAGASMDMGAMTMLVFKKDDREVAVQVMNDGKQTTINVIAKK